MLSGLGLSWGAGLRMVVAVACQLNGTCGIILEQKGRPEILEDCHGLTCGTGERIGRLKVRKPMDSEQFIDWNESNLKFWSLQRNFLQGHADIEQEILAFKQQILLVEIPVTPGSFVGLLSLKKSLCFNVIIMLDCSRDFRASANFGSSRVVPGSLSVPQQLSELGQKFAGLFGCCLKLPLLMMRPFLNAPMMWIFLWLDLKDVLKQILQHCIKKYGGEAGGCDNTFFFLPHFFSFFHFQAGLKSLVPFRLPTWILLNQDRK